MRSAMRGFFGVLVLAIGPLARGEESPPRLRISYSERASREQIGFEVLEFKSGTPRQKKALDLGPKYPGYFLEVASKEVTRNGEKGSVWFEASVLSPEGKEEAYLSGTLPRRLSSGVIHAVGFGGQAKAKKWILTVQSVAE
jgi:hypothetical protein